MTTEQAVQFIELQETTNTLIENGINDFKILILFLTSIIFIYTLLKLTYVRGE